MRLSHSWWKKEKRNDGRRAVMKQEERKERRCGSVYKEFNKKNSTYVKKITRKNAPLESRRKGFKHLQHKEKKVGEQQKKNIEREEDEFMQDGDKDKNTSRKKKKKKKKTKKQKTKTKKKKQNKNKKKKKKKKKKLKIL